MAAPGLRRAANLQPISGRKTLAFSPQPAAGPSAPLKCGDSSISKVNYVGTRSDGDMLTRNKRAIYDAATNFQATDLERALVLAMAMVGAPRSCHVAEIACRCVMLMTCLHQTCPLILLCRRTSADALRASADE